ncbi:MAG TPA: lactate racemase domain-containing protein [Planctomycetota bacterium]|nr:lactate racemase domain-containing protein [Planctomycetota bacterium]
MADTQTILLAVGRGLTITPPASAQVLPLVASVDPGSPLLGTQQQELIRTALAGSDGSAPLREIAKDHRHVAILAGDLSLPAPYDIALPPVMNALVEAGIRPTRISIIACPGHGTPILGRGAIHRYGEEIVGDHELHAFIKDGPGEALYAKADLRIAVVPSAAGEKPFGEDFRHDYAVALQIGRKAVIDIVGASAGSALPAHMQNSKPIGSADVAFTTGGGAEWESTLEEALPGLWHAAPENENSSAVLAFTGDEGLGSAHFTNDLWTLLKQAEEVLAQGGSFKNAVPRPLRFDPAMTLAYALSTFERVIFYSPEFAQHPEGDELNERLAELPQLSQRLGLLGSESGVWELLQRAHGTHWTLRVNPLGWRGVYKD